MRSSEKGQLIYHNHSSLDFGMYVETPITIPTPEPDITATHVNGRNGDILQPYHSFKNISLTVQVSVFKPSKYRNLYQLKNAITDWLIDPNPKYDYLKFSDNREWVWEAVVNTPPVLTPLQEQGVEEEIDGSITFNCKPIMKRNNGTYWQPVHESFSNTTNMTAIPDWHIVGNGTYVLTVNGLTYTFNSVDGEVYVDGENCQVYKSETENRSSMVEFANNDAPILVPGDNTVVLAGDTPDKFEFRPNWRRLA
ncbi:hypothetical protein [Lactobacillus sp. ESL0677]|uniref:hypothetical protein n=1 Tax=Lactobacillus sp. ESL0677 TaxID=2983208 RepID=UPI0023F64A32|nr:hypothetical protein [Lactobacillus sp. ESL0677]WEV36211.1 hypothetical protein OZX76_05545 [Lactobacillus sp. ESL0677]